MRIWLIPAILQDDLFKANTAFFSWLYYVLLLFIVVVLRIVQTGKSFEVKVKWISRGLWIRDEVPLPCHWPRGTSFIHFGPHPSTQPWIDHLTHHKLHKFNGLGWHLPEQSMKKKIRIKLALPTITIPLHSDISSNKYIKLNEDNYPDVYLNYINV